MTAKPSSLFVRTDVDGDELDVFHAGDGLVFHATRAGSGEMVSVHLRREHVEKLLDVLTGHLDGDAKLKASNERVNEMSSEWRRLPRV